MSLQSLHGLDPQLDATARRAEAALYEYQNHRLQQILQYLEQRDVDLCVLPEYCLPATEAIMETLAGFAPRICIIAGLGIPREGGIRAINKYTEDAVGPSMNLAVVFSGNQCRIVTKRHPSEHEHIAVGSGVGAYPVTIGGREYRVGVAICKDYLEAGHAVSHLAERPDFLCIPALSASSEVFKPDSPRDFPRVLANHAKYGGSRILASGCEGVFVQDGDPQPIPAGAEGILAIDWHGPKARPTGIHDVPNRVTLRSGILTSSENSANAVAEIADAFRVLSEANPIPDDADITLSRWIQFARGKKDLSLLQQSMEILKASFQSGVTLPEVSSVLAQHLVARGTPSLMELRSTHLRAILKRVRNLVSPESGDGPNLALLGQALAEYSSASGVTSPAEPGTQQATPNQAICHFSLGLGSFDPDDAHSTLESQQDLLRTFARSSPVGSFVRYALDTEENPASGVIGGHFSIAFFGPDTPAAREYFGSLERIARPIFLRGWGLSGGRSGALPGTRMAIVPQSGTRLRVRDDLGVLVDILRATGPDLSLEMFGTPVTSGHDHVTRPAGPPPQSAVAASSAHVGLELNSAGTWFKMQRSGAERLDLRIELVTPQLNHALCQVIGTMLFDGPFNIVDPSDPDDAAWPDSPPLEEAHRALHPPHGHIAGRGIGKRPPLKLTMSESLHLKEGAYLGRATVARPFVDEDVDVRIPEASRRLHTYVIGRTGSGKTNTLKNVARHDIKRGGTVVVIDPHGDLFDYCIRHAAPKRDILALDLAASSPPRLNPIFLDAFEPADIKRNIDELVEIFIRATHHQFAGPRFADLMRLCLETLVALHSEEKGHAPGLPDVPRLIEEREYRNGAIARLRSAKRDDLARRWDLHHRMQPTEQAEVEQWFISKFGEFRGAGVFSGINSGVPEISLKRAVERGSVVLVRIPRATLGDAATRFVGALIVERVFRYTLEGAFLGTDVPASLIVDEFQHFVGSSFERLVPEARKFNLGLTVANQTLSQLAAFSQFEGGVNDRLFQIIIGNVGNLIIHSVGRHDARRLAPEVGLEDHDLLRIGKFSAVVQLTANWVREEPFTVRMDDASAVPNPVAETVAESQVAEMLRHAGEELSRLPFTTDSEPDSGSESLTPEPPVNPFAALNAEFPNTSPTPQRPDWRSVVARRPSSTDDEVGVY